MKNVLPPLSFVFSPRNHDPYRLISSPQVAPPPPWLNAFEAASQPLLSSQFLPQDLSITTWAIARLGFRPSAQWMESLLQVRGGRRRDLAPSG